MRRDISRFVVESSSACIKPDNDIVCKSCIYRDKRKHDWYKKGVCEVFKDHKPIGVMFKNEKCPSYKRDE